VLKAGALLVGKSCFKTDSDQTHTNYSTEDLFTVRNSLLCDPGMSTGNTTTSPITGPPNKIRRVAEVRAVKDFHLLRSSGIINSDLNLEDTSQHQLRLRD